MKMELRLLEYFLAVDAAQNFSQAAINLHITQPTLTRQIQQLEDIYGAKLFIRGSRKATLTQSGMILKRRALEILELQEVTIQEIQATEQNIFGSVAIGCGDSNGSNLVPLILKEFSRKYPQVKYHLYSGGDSFNKEKISSGIIDVAIVLGQPDAQYYESIPLRYFDQWCVMMSTTDPLTSREFIVPGDLEAKPLGMPSRKEVQKTFQKWIGHDISSQVVVEFDLNINLALMVKNNLCYGITIEGAAANLANDQLTYRLLQPKIESQAYLIWKKNVNTTKAVAKFISLAKEIVKE